ncbi:fibrillin-2, partial [Biomphalaria glabrata]
LSLCRLNSSFCRPNEWCIDTHFLPVCQAFCDYGQYLDGKNCVNCTAGQTTLMRNAWPKEVCV